MNLLRRHLLHMAFAACVATPAMVAAAAADDYPSHPVTIIVGYPPGGPTDLVAHILAESMRKTLGQTVIVENSGGAAGTIGSAKVARATPDGYTIMVSQWSAQVGAPGAMKLAFDPIESFEPISMLTTSPLWLIGRPGLPAKDIKELLAWMKANSGKATIGQVGYGSAAHVFLVDFEHKTGTKFAMVPYKGGAPTMQDLIGGQIDLSVLEAGQTLANVKAGKIKAYAVATKKRWFADPDVPTFEEAGVKGLLLPFWHGMWAPKGTPKPIIDKLVVAVQTAFRDKDVQKHLADLGHEIPPFEEQNPKALATYHKAELDKWWPVMRSAGIVPK